MGRVGKGSGGVGMEVRGTGEGRVGAKIADRGI